MCGIAGIISAAPADFKGGATIENVCASMRARGPDAVGYWTDTTNGISLGHRRLSVIDVDERANQPMTAGCERYVIVFNGEIYNFRELRQMLEVKGEGFQTRSDTEVLLKLYRREKQSMLKHLRGMYAIAIWDQQLRELFLARDPYGIKPLYIARIKNGWLFASQVKALLASGLVSQAPDAVGQMGFWLLGSVPEPHTWFRNITALPAGNWCKIQKNGVISGPHSYWDISNAWREVQEYQGTILEAQDVVSKSLAESVRLHLVADVPVGVLLSGGIDSGSLAGLIKDSGHTTVQGITIAFNEFKGKKVDEVPVARKVARQFGIRHHVRTVTQEEIEIELPRILSAMDQPSIDGINTWFACKAVAELGLKVVISGIGGDELFCGYESFRQLPRLVRQWQVLSSVPGVPALAHRILSQYAQSRGEPRWRWITRQANSLYGAYWLRRGLFTPEELPALMGAELAEEALRGCDPSKLVESLAGRLSNNGINSVGQMESTIYLRNQLLRDSDWASMAHSVELRTPLVDAWLLEDLSRVMSVFSPPRGKRMLAKSPRLPLSDKVIRRVKTGFGIPLGKWNRKQMQTAQSESEASNAERGASSRHWAQVVAKEIYKR